MDIRDGPGPRHAPDTPFQYQPAFEWLTAHAAEFGFENSFPRGNVQGVMYEPWHWRWIGDDLSNEVLARFRALTAADRWDPRVGEALRNGGDAGIARDADPDVRQIFAQILEKHMDKPLAEHTLATRNADLCRFARPSAAKALMSV